MIVHAATLLAGLGFGAGLLWVLAGAVFTDLPASEPWPSDFIPYQHRCSLCGAFALDERGVCGNCGAVNRKGRAA